RLHIDLEKALAHSRAARAVEDESAKQAATRGEEDDDTIEAPSVATHDDIRTTDVNPALAQVKEYPRLASSVTVSTPSPADDANKVQRVFSPTDLSAFPANSDSFFDFSYRSTLKAMVDAVIEHEAPLREDVLGQRIARAHGWLRTGARIRDQIANHLRRLERTHETSGVFLWKPGTVSSRVPFRQPLNEAHRRALSDICLAELVDFILSYPAALDETDAPLVYARLLQLERLAASSRERLEEAITTALALAPK
ncbi:MAG: DUF3320 domain-containing protein, partial [Legionella sp.]|nr:DUF3320 domain-containing protein [Legionella sp.]